MNKRAVFTVFWIIGMVCSLHAQPCTSLGQTPSTAFPVCGTTVFTQNSVPLCSTNSLFVPGCTGDGANYENKNPFFYRFTCYQSGTLGFTVTPLAANEDYDWQLYDITGRNPDDIFTNRNIIVSGNWAGTYGPTGASATGVNFIQCASDPSANAPTFARMPDLLIDHEYILLVSHYTNTQSGYNLSFSGGSAIITDPLLPKLSTVKADCDGKVLRLKLNKKVRCNSLTTTGSEFSILPAITSVVSAVPDSCSTSFDFDETTIQLATALPNGTYELVINNGTDANSLLDICGRDIPPGDKLSFTYFVPLPIFADSIGRTGCAPDSIKLYFPKRILCASIDPAGTDFVVTGPSAVVVQSAGGNCINGKTDFVTVKFTRPIQRGGSYQLLLRAGTDTTVLVDECGLATPVQTISFPVADTVNAVFNYTATLGCQRNVYRFTHPGGNGITNWNWLFNGTRVTTPSHTIEFPSSSTNTISLLVSNGICVDSSRLNLVINNQVKAAFTIQDSILCPEDKLLINNTSTGAVDVWQWQYDVLGSSSLKDPLPYQFPNLNLERNYRVKLIARNQTMRCSDSAERIIKVLNHCLIDVPTAFTPNNDGLNDLFRPHNALKAINYHFRVFNRWGQLVFESRNWMEKWDGKINGQTQGTGVYVWILSYTHRDTGQSIFKKGTVTLIK
ncbi:MAG: gliding motility-associated C-terminal domain-containing protein [Bacteroidetes bacterium]|nr:gliding motility-associated C-terminal domain-containing protein [Bacteroidota bacterium]